VPTPATCDQPGPTGTSLYAVEGLPDSSPVCSAQSASARDARFMAAELSGHEFHRPRQLPEYVDRWRCGKADPAG
jgi:hypothetical protein